jgi:hypothetical protein
MSGIRNFPPYDELRRARRVSTTTRRPVPRTPGRELLLTRHTEAGRDVALLLEQLGLMLPLQAPLKIRYPAKGPL